MPERLLRTALVACFVLAVSSRASAGPVLIDFETLSDGQEVGSLLGPLLTFTGATALTAGQSLNDVEFPPFSGANVIFDSSSSIRIDFAAPVANISAYFSYVAPLSLQFFDSSNTLLGSATSLFDLNFASSGNPPNELITGAFTGISYLVIASSVGGNSFVLDDLGFETLDENPPPVPEPSTIVLLGSGAIAWLGARRKRRAQRA